MAAFKVSGWDPSVHDGASLLTSVARKSAAAVANRSVGSTGKHKSNGHIVHKRLDHLDTKGAITRARGGCKFKGNSKGKGKGRVIKSVGKEQAVFFDSAVVVGADGTDRKGFEVETVVDRRSTDKGTDEYLIKWRVSLE
jgi:hypothetical protein